MEENRYTQLMLEQIVLGEREMPEAMKYDEIVMKRIEELRSSNREILERYPAEGTIKRIEARLVAEDDRVAPVRFRIGRGVSFLAAAALVVLAGLIPVFLGRSGSDSTGSIRIKGSDDAQIRIYRRAGESVQRLDERSFVKENDLLQIAYLRGQKRFGAILSIDGRGIVTVHYPYDSSTSAVLDPGGEIALDYSYQLDDAPGFERFFFLTSDEEFAVLPVQAGLRALAKSTSDGASGDLALPDHIEQYSVLLIKESSR